MELESETQKAGSPPDYTSRDGVSVWINKKKDGEQYLTVQLLGKNGIKVNCFKYTPRPKEFQQNPPYAR